MTRQLAPTTDKTVEETLEQFRGQLAYRVPMCDENGIDFGNNGDELIQLGGEKLLNRFELKRCSSPVDADVLVMRGNGAMIRGYSKARRVLLNAWNDFPDKPLLMLPATFHYPDGDFFDDLGPRNAPVVLYCRERYSYDHLLNDQHIPDCCTIGLGHDMAFQLADDPLVTSRQDRTGKHVLIVERNDAEHPTNHQTFWSSASQPYTSVTRWIPSAFKRPLYPIRSMLRRRRRTPFREYCERRVERGFPDFVKFPRIIDDVSDKTTGDFTAFCDRIADAAVVFSTRLHVGIFAAMLGKRTFVFEGPYHKIRAIYEHSMTGMQNVTFVSRDEYLI